MDEASKQDDDTFDYPWLVCLHQNRLYQQMFQTGIRDDIRRK